MFVALLGSHALRTRIIHRVLRFGQSRLERGIYILARVSKSSITAEHSVDSDIFYAVFHLPAPSKTYALTFISKSSVKS